MSTTMSKPNKRQSVSDFFLLSKVGYPIFMILTVLFVGVIPAILISVAQYYDR